MDDIRGGKANFLEQPTNSQFFDPLESTQLMDEIHKLFQLIDLDAKGFVTMQDIAEFQDQVAKSK